MYRILIAVAAMISASCTQDIAPAPPSGPARIQFEQTTVDLGEISVRREPYRADFRFINRGLDSLQINLLEKSCTCLDAGVSKAVVAPTETGLIVIEVAADRAAEKTAEVIVHSNDEVDPRIRLDVVWRAVAPIEFDPLLLNFGVVRPGSSIERTVSVLHRQRSNSGNCQVLSVHSASRELAVSYMRPANGSDASVSVRLTSGSESGRRTGTVRAILDGCWTEELSLPVEWTVREVIEATPRRLMLGFGQPGETLHKKLIVRCDPGETLQVSAISLEDLPWANTMAQQAAEEVATIDVTATLPPRMGEHVGELRIECSAPAQHTLVVPVRAVVRGGEQASLRAAEDGHAQETAAP